MLLRDIFQNRLFIGALAFFILCVVGGTLYMGYVEREGSEDAAETQDRDAELNEKQNPTPQGKAAGDLARWARPRRGAAPVEETPSESPTAVMPDWNSLTEEQREHQLLMDTMASKPIFAEIYQLMTENESPYSPEVHAKIQAATWRVLDKVDAEYAGIQAERMRLAAIIIDHKWASLTDEEKLQRNKVWNQQVIAEYANDPRYAELYKLMTENPLPYSPDVEAQIHEANNRIREKGAAYDKAVAEIDAKMRDPNISPREYGRLIRERSELRNRYKGGQ